MRLIVGLVLAALLVGGCSKPPPRGLLLYLRQIAPFEQSLGQLMQEMKRIPTFPGQQRIDFANGLVSKIHSERDRLQALSAPPVATRLHGNLLALYGTLDGYITRSMQGSGDPHDPVLARLAADWKQELTLSQTELENLSHMVGDK
jgi:hypothetical protein